MLPGSIARRKHVLRKFLEGFVWRHFFGDIPLEEPALARYVTILLSDFAHTDSPYRIRNAVGRRLEDVGEMVIESNPLLEASSFDRERAVRKHVGDYTLFMTGLLGSSRRTWRGCAKRGGRDLTRSSTMCKPIRSPMRLCRYSTSSITGTKRRRSAGFRRILSCVFRATFFSRTSWTFSSGNTFRRFR